MKRTEPGTNLPPKPESDVSSKAKQALSNLFEQAVAAHKAGRLSEAEQIYRSILEHHPKEPETLYLLGTVLGATGRIRDAIDTLKLCTQHKPDHLPALTALGVLYARDKQHGQAISVLSQATEIGEDKIEPWFNLGKAYIDIEDYENGLKTFRRAIDIKFDHWQAANGYGLCLSKLGRAEEAIDFLAECIEQDPQQESLRQSLIKCLIEAEQYEKVRTHSLDALTIWPEKAQFHAFLSIALQKEGDEDAALTSLKRALELEPENVFALNLIANHLYALGRWKEAESYAQSSLEIEPHSSKALNNMGRIRQMRGDLDGAEQWFKRSIAQDPDFGDAYNNLGNLYLYTDRISQAVEAFDQSIELKPDVRGFRFNRAAAVMSNGEPAPVWRDHRLRFEKRDNTVIAEQWPWECWNGESLDGKQILLWAEQGIGDQVLFSRYALHFAAQSAGSVLVCDQRLVSLFVRSFPDLPVMTREELIEDSSLMGSIDIHGAVIDVCCAAINQPLDVPTAPLLKPDATLVETLREKYLTLSGGRPLIGISWRSGGSHHTHFKSTDLSAWSEILSNADVTFVNLQYGDMRKEIEEATSAIGAMIIDDETVNPMGDLNPFAAQTAAMDLIITTSNTTAHIAGGLGKEVWNMTPTGPGRLWYWFTEGEETPWYPSMKLYRHSYTEPWAKVLSAVGQDLAAAVPRITQ